MSCCSQIMLWMVTTLKPFLTEPEQRVRCWEPAGRECWEQGLLWCPGRLVMGAPREEEMLQERQSSVCGKEKPTKNAWREGGSAWSLFKLKPDQLPSVCSCSDVSVSVQGQRGAPSILSFESIYLAAAITQATFFSSACTKRKIPHSSSV